MSAQDPGRGHERARELAAMRADEILPPEDEAWLADHLDYCDACAAVAAEYDAQHELFADLRAWTPEPPRDLWARTAAKIDAERGHTTPRRRRFASPMALRLSLAPVAAFVAVVVVVSAGLLNAGPAQPQTTATAATPIALADAAAVQVIVRDGNGNVQLVTRPMNEVCPVGTNSCGAQPTAALTAVSGVKSATTLQGAISPSGDKMVVIAQDGSGDTLYVVPVRVASPAPSKSPAPVPSTAPPTASAATSETPLASASASFFATESVIASGTAAPASSSASASGPASTAPSGTTSSPAPASPDTSASASPAPSDSASTAPTASDVASASSSPMPSVEVTPGPDAAIKIASGVTVIGVPVYAPDGVHLAFAAMPSDGSAGPDIYTWAPGDKHATAITSDHGSWLAGWTADGILVSRVASGQPSTFVLDPASGRPTAIGDPGTWLPAVSPDGKTAAWWDGTLRLAADGVSWTPDSGRLVIGAWPNAAGSSRQTIAKGPIADWTARWSDDSGAIAVWADTQGKGAGKLSLYRVDAGNPDLANPMLNGEPATSGFSIRTGRLAWTAPSPTPPQVVEVLAWSGKTIGRLEVPADGSGTVLP